MTSAPEDPAVEERSVGRLFGVTDGVFAIATPAMIRRTFLLLLAVTTMPFAASLLARHGDAAGVAATVYAAVNIVAIVALLSIRAEAARDTLSVRSLRRRSTELLLDLIAYLIAVPVAFLLPRHGVETLFIALAVSGVTNRAIGHRARHRPSPT